MNRKTFEWTVIGAGPAGIAAIGKLLDNGVAAEKIVWIDPHFSVGDLGRLWKNVSSNTTVRLFQQFLNDCSSFSYPHASPQFELNALPSEETCLLKHIAEPLQWITNRLQDSVQTIKAMVHEMKLSERAWKLDTHEQTISTKNVILANGATPVYLNYPEIETVSFETAIDKEKLSQFVQRDETCAVFGSSHSAIIILQHLVDIGVKKIFNFYRSPCRYAVNMGDWILFDNTGLKGRTAAWARCNIDGTHPDNLVRVLATEKHITRFLPECNKAIYAVGFKPRNNIILHGFDSFDYNTHTGIIGPGLFGFGIAYPEAKPDPFGTIELQVGLWKFMTYLNKVMPIWLKYPA